MSVQLCQIIINTVHDYISLFDKKRSQYIPQFAQSLLIDSDAVKAVIRLQPTVEQFQSDFASVIDSMAASLAKITPVHIWFDGLVGSYLKAAPDPVFVADSKRSLAALVDDFFVSPLATLDSLKVHIDLLAGGSHDTAVQAFVAEDRKFDEYKQLVTKYEALAETLQPIVEHQDFALVRLDATPLKLGLIALAKGYGRAVLVGLASMHKKAGQRICHAFDVIVRKALTEPEDTKDIMEQVSYINRVRGEEIPALGHDIAAAQARMLYLLDQHEFSEEELVLNTAMLTWPRRILPVFDDNALIMERAKAKGEETLAGRREKVVLEIEKVRKRMQEFNDNADVEMVSHYVKDVQQLQKRLQELGQSATFINKEETLFGFEKTSYPTIQQLVLDSEPFLKLYSNALKWTKTEKKWLDGPLTDLCPDAVEGEHDEFWRETYKMAKTYPDTTAMFKICDAVKNRIHSFRSYKPVIATMCNPGLRERHWKQMSAVANVDLQPDSSTTLQKVLNLKLDEFLEQFESISGAASKEFSLEKAMDRMAEDWLPIQFGTVPYRTSGVNILSSVDEIQSMLDDHLVKTQTMRGSPFIKPFAERIKAWETKLMYAQDTIDQWLKVQATWLYLEPIFSSPDIISQMPREGDLFTAVDRSWRDIMRNCTQNPNVLEACAYEGILETLKTSNHKLEAILKGLNDYLEKKRLFFARFFFLSNDEMLEILSETKDPTRVQPHLKKCFEGINTLKFTPELDITHMISGSNEEVQLIESISTSAARGSVEKWLLQLEYAMKGSLRNQISRAKEAFNLEPREHWVRQWPGQVVIAIDQTFWTTGVHEAIRVGPTGLTDFYDKQQKDLEEIVALVRGKLPKNVRITLGALVTLDVHARDVVADLIESKVSSEMDFQWLSQLRYYWENDNQYVRMINCTCDYGYEYLGNQGRLVVTPLTDRCYRTLIGAYALHLGGAPEGPAGTGKTETVKDLAKAMAIQCVVFNVSFVVFLFSPCCFNAFHIAVLRRPGLPCHGFALVNSSGILT